MIQLTDFEQMYKDWMVRDYFNPSIKAEVNFDTLLSGFITEMVAYKLEDAPFNAKDLCLFAKEFPISNGVSPLASAKIDYVLLKQGSEDRIPEIIMVELKTKRHKFAEIEPEKQYRRYVDYIENDEMIERFWEHYKKIIDAKVKSSYFDKEKIELRKSQKYVNQLRELERLVKQDIFGDASKFSNCSFDNLEGKARQKYMLSMIDFIKDLLKEQKAKIRLVYLSLEEIFGFDNRDNCKNIVVQDLIDDEIFECYLKEQMSLLDKTDQEIADRVRSFKIISEIVQAIFGEKKMQI